MFHNLYNDEYPTIYVQIIVKEFLHLYFSTLGEFGCDFYNQDVQIMPGQDQRKTTWSDADDGDSESKSRSSWNDVYPTTNDKGV
jgi:hypothetical protein